MLKLRVVTAAVLVVVMIVTLWFLPPLGVGIVLGAFVLVAAWEWGALSGLRTIAGRAAYLIVVALFGAYLLRASTVTVVGLAFVFWTWVLAELVFYKGSRRGALATRGGRLASGVCVLVPAWFAAYHLHAIDPRRPSMLLFLFVLVWVADSAAYFAGKAFGKTQLAPAVSPGKSVEGVLGGVAAVAVLAATAGVFVWQFQGTMLAAWLAIAVATALYSVLGDLLESKAKRLAGVKDSGRLLPGHGGVLDRIDAFTAAAPVFVFGLWVFGRWLGGVGDPA